MNIGLSIHSHSYTHVIHMLGFIVNTCRQAKVLSHGNPQTLVECDENPGAMDSSLVSTKFD